MCSWEYVNRKYVKKPDASTQLQSAIYEPLTEPKLKIVNEIWELNKFISPDCDGKLFNLFLLKFLRYPQ